MSGSLDPYRNFKCSSLESNSKLKCFEKKFLSEPNHRAERFQIQKKKPLNLNIVLVWTIQENTANIENSVVIAAVSVKSIKTLYKKISTEVYNAIWWPCGVRWLTNQP